MPKSPKKSVDPVAAKDKKRKPAKAKPPKAKLTKAKLTKAKPAKAKAAAKFVSSSSETPRPAPPLALGPGAAVLDRLWSVVMSRRNADPAVSHSARLLSRGMPKVAQKFGEEAVECLIEAVAGNREALVAESADVLYHLLVVWVSAGVSPDEVWTELKRREGISGITEKASRAKSAPVRLGIQTTKIP